MKKKWEHVYVYEGICSRLKLKKVMTLEEAKSARKTEKICNVFDDLGAEYMGILGVDVSKKDLRKMGFRHL